MSTVDIPLLTIAPTTSHTHTVIFLHGRGDNARNFAGSLAGSPDSHGRTLIDAFPSFRWVFPQAPTRECASSPDVWPQWFDVWNVRDLSENENLQVLGLREVVPAICRIVAVEAALLGGAWERVIIAGISMGGATSARVLFNLNLPPGKGLGAFLGFSCRLPFAGQSLVQMRELHKSGNAPGHNDVLRYTPVLLEHCIDDPLVRIRDGKVLRDALREFGAKVEWKEYQSGGHWFNSPVGMDDAVDFLNRHVLSPTNVKAGAPPEPEAMDLS